MKKTVFALLFMAGCLMYAEDISDDALFGDSGIVAQEKIVNDKLIEAEIDKKSLGVSGELSSTNTYVLSKEFIDGTAGGYNKNIMSNIVSGNLFMDARLPRGIKGYANFQFGYSQDRSEMAIDLKEIFIDTNIDKKIYIRTGKQSLEWGRGYFWHPTDLINIEKKAFVSSYGYKAGVSGVKLHVPFGTEYNVYGFFDAEGAKNLNEFGYAGKFEFLVNKTAEVAVSAWNKGNSKTVVGVDFSVPKIFGGTITGEAAFSNGDNKKKVKLNGNSIDLSGTNGTPVVLEAKEELTPKVSISYRKSFDVGDNKNALSLAGEVFYNHNGYTENIFKDFGTNTSVDGKTMQAATAQTTNVLTVGDYMQRTGLYETNYHSKYYGAMFASLSKFLGNSDLSASTNIMANLNDGSYIISPGISYNDSLSGISIGGNVSIFGGPDNSEFTYSKRAVSAQLSTSISF